MGCVFLLRAHFEIKNHKTKIKSSIREFSSKCKNYPFPKNKDALITIFFIFLWAILIFSSFGTASKSDHKSNENYDHYDNCAPRC